MRSAQLFVFGQNLLLLLSAAAEEKDCGLQLRKGGGGTTRAQEKSGQYSLDKIAIFHLILDCEATALSAELFPKLLFSVVSAGAPRTTARHRESTCQYILCSTRACLHVLLDLYYEFAPRLGLNIVNELASRVGLQKIIALCLQLRQRPRERRGEGEGAPPADTRRRPRPKRSPRRDIRN